MIDSDDIYTFRRRSFHPCLPSQKAADCNVSASVRLRGGSAAQAVCPKRAGTDPCAFECHCCQPPT
jgi:hypothetical protein